MERICDESRDLCIQICRNTGPRRLLFMISLKPDLRTQIIVISLPCTVWSIFRIQHKRSAMLSLRKRSLYNWPFFSWRYSPVYLSQLRGFQKVITPWKTLRSEKWWGRLCSAKRRRMGRLEYKMAARIYQFLFLSCWLSPKQENQRMFCFNT